MQKAHVVTVINNYFFEPPDDVEVSFFVVIAKITSPEETFVVRVIWKVHSYITLHKDRTL